jgi:hypothetical protein
MRSQIVASPCGEAVGAVWEWAGIAGGFSKEPVVVGVWGVGKPAPFTQNGAHFVYRFLHYISIQSTPVKSKVLPSIHKANNEAGKIRKGVNV